MQVSKCIPFVSDTVCLDKDVRFNPDLVPGERLLLGEIKSITSSGNKFYYDRPGLSNMFGVATPTITTWVKNLVNKGYIQISFNINDKKCKHTLNPCKKRKVG